MTTHPFTRAILGKIIVFGRLLGLLYGVKQYGIEKNMNEIGLLKQKLTRDRTLVNLGF